MDSGASTKGFQGLAVLGPGNACQHRTLLLIPIKAGRK